jgi:hypothetical protein
MNSSSRWTASSTDCPIARSSEGLPLLLRSTSYEVLYPEWMPLAPDFATFFARYIQAEGFPETIASTG